MEKEYCLQLKEKLVKEYREHKVYPKPLDIFRAFELTPFEQVKVVILGQDPYPFGEHADGLAFSSKLPETPASLRVILKEVDRDVVRTKDHKEFEKAFPTNDLTSWAKQGVLLLNTSLTVRAGEVNSHRGMWDQFIEKVIYLLWEQPRPKVFMLWGAEARETFNRGHNPTQIGVEPGRHKALGAGHPATASKGRDLFSGSNHFSRANHYLEKQGIEPIEWRLKRPTDGD